MRVLNSSLLRIAAGSVFILWQPPADAAKSRQPADQVFWFLSRYYSIPPGERDKFMLTYCIRIDGRPPAGRFALETGRERKAIVLDPKGCVEQLPNPKELTGQAAVLMEDNAPAGAHEFAVEIGMRASIRPAREISVADCVSALAQANAAIQEVTARLGIAAKIKRVGFPGAGAGVAVLNNGKMAPLPTSNGMPIFDPSTTSGARTIRLDREPSSILFPDSILPPRNSN